jgi:hypothetical protein
MRKFAAGALVAAGGPALAQVGGQAAWLWDVTTENGDAIVEPGETATITLSIDMTPDVNGPDGPVIGFGVANFNTIGGGGAANGQILEWEILNTLDDLTGDLTETDGVSLTNTWVGQDPDFGEFVFLDPLDVLQFKWGTVDYGNYTVAYDTETLAVGNPPMTQNILVWEGEFLGEFDVFHWPIAEAAIVFDVVPAPSGLALVAGGIACMSARRRS